MQKEEINRSKQLVFKTPHPRYMWLESFTAHERHSHGPAGAGIEEGNKTGRRAGTPLL